MSAADTIERAASATRKARSGSSATANRNDQTPKIGGIRPASARLQSASQREACRVEVIIREIIAISAAYEAAEDFSRKGKDCGDKAIERDAFHARETLDVLFDRELALRQVAALTPARSPAGAMFQLALVKDALDDIVDLDPEEQTARRALLVRKILSCLNSAIDVMAGMAGVGRQSAGVDLFMHRAYDPHRRLAAALAGRYGTPPELFEDGAEVAAATSAPVAPADELLDAIRRYEDGDEAFRAGEASREIGGDTDALAEATYQAPMKRLCAAPIPATSGRAALAALRLALREERERGEPIMVNLLIAALAYCEAHLPRAEGQAGTAGDPMLALIAEMQAGAFAYNDSPDAGSGVPEIETALIARTYGPAYDRARNGPLPTPTTRLGAAEALRIAIDDDHDEATAKGFQVAVLRFLERSDAL